MHFRPWISNYSEYQNAPFKTTGIKEKMLWCIKQRQASTDHGDYFDPVEERNFNIARVRLVESEGNWYDWLGYEHISCHGAYSLPGQGIVSWIFFSCEISKTQSRWSAASSFKYLQWKNGASKLVDFSRWKQGGLKISSSRWVHHFNYRDQWIDCSKNHKISGPPIEEGSRYRGATDLPYRKKALFHRLYSFEVL